MSGLPFSGQSASTSLGVRKFFRSEIPTWGQVSSLLNHLNLEDFLQVEDAHGGRRLNLIGLLKRRGGGESAKSQNKKTKP